MKLKTNDLKMLMDYMEKEKVLFVEVLNNVDGIFQPYVSFEFTDAEHRRCTIKVFDSVANVAPELTKSMKLLTRLKKEKVQVDE